MVLSWSTWTELLRESFPDVLMGDACVLTKCFCTTAGNCSRRHEQLTVPEGHSFQISWTSLIHYHCKLLMQLLRVAQISKHSESDKKYKIQKIQKVSIVFKYSVKQETRLKSAGCNGWLTLDELLIRRNELELINKTNFEPISYNFSHIILSIFAYFKWFHLPEVTWHRY